VSKGPGRIGTRVGRTRDWLGRQTDSWAGRLAFLWFRRYMQASKNSGSATTAYFMLSVIPTALVAIAFFDQSGGDTNALAERLITHMHLDGTVADIVRQTFGTTASNAVAATVAVVISFLFWGIGIGQLYRDVYMRAWRVETAQASDQALFTIWYFVTCGLLGCMFVATTETASSSRALFIPAWLAAAVLYWLWTPRFLLHRKVPTRKLLPGALLGAFVLGGTLGTSPLWMGPTLNQNAKAFGSFGVVLAMIAFVLIAITISMACAVFAPVWEEFRQRETERKSALAKPVETEPTANMPARGASLGDT
jgi:membrane protein